MLGDSDRSTKRSSELIQRSVLREDKFKGVPSSPISFVCVRLRRPGRRRHVYWEARGVSGMAADGQRHRRYTPHARQRRAIASHAEYKTGWGWAGGLLLYNIKELTMSLHVLYGIVSLVPADCAPQAFAHHGVLRPRRAQSAGDAAARARGRPAERDPARGAALAVALGLQNAGACAVSCE